MPQTWEMSIDELLIFGFGCCLCFTGLILVLRQYRRGFFLSLCFLALGITLITNQSILIKGIATLMVWPAFYLYVSQRHQRIHGHWHRSLHFLIPAMWGLALGLEFSALSQWLETLAFLQFIPYVLLTLVESYRQFRSTVFRQALQPAYAQWTFIGLLIVIAIRLLLPIFPIDLPGFISVFHGAVGLYLIGIFSFSIHGPFRKEEWTLRLGKEEGSNYEEELKRRLDLLLNKEKIFVIPDLTLQELSSKMQVRSAALSGFFNSSLGRNFNEVINEHRVEEVKRLMRDPNTDPKATLMELAYRSGFNSKATFNRIFKEMTGMTPRAFKTQMAE